MKESLNKILRANGVADNETELHVLGTIETCEKCKQSIRKETAKEILQYLYDLCHKDNPFGDYDLTDFDVKELAKVYGVEVDE